MCGGDKWDVERALVRGSRELSIVFEIDSLILLTKTDIKFPALESIDFFLTPHNYLTLPS